MHVEDLRNKQYFILDRWKHRCHRVDVDNVEWKHARVWVETTTGTLLSVPLGTFVEPTTASTKVAQEVF